MFLMGQYECHGRKHLQYETTWRSTSERLELSRWKGSKRLRKLRQSAVAHNINSKPSGQKVRRFSAFVISSHSVSEEGDVYSSLQYAGTEAMV